MDIYGCHRPVMEDIMKNMVSVIDDDCRNPEGDRLFEHISCRIKSDAGTREKLVRSGVPEDERSALTCITDSIGIRVVCHFIDDVYECARIIRGLPGFKVIKEKDYIQNAKSNGYRSYHMILSAANDKHGEDSRLQRSYFAEVQLRTIAMDTWAALEHEMKYKKNIKNSELIAGELKRCANDLAACDVSMQTIRQIIKEWGWFTG